MQESMGKITPTLLSPISWAFSKFGMISVEQGALNSLYLASSPDVVEKNYKNKYIVPFAQLEEPIDLAKNEELATRLWDFTDSLVNEKLK
jgi:hypothetical protein